MPKLEVIQFKRLFENVKIPRYGSEGAAGFDLEVHNFKRIYVVSSDDIEFNIETQPDSISLVRGQRLLVGCGFAVKLPAGYELQVRSRSGKSLKEGLVVANSPGTIDEDYTGEIGVILNNISSDVITIKLGDKVAQSVLKEYVKAAFEVVTELDTTKRGSGGFGSTDAHSYVMKHDSQKLIN